MSGLFLLDRDVLNHHIVGKSNDRVVMWIWLLSAAAWKQRRIFVLGSELTLQRGQLFVTIRTFAEQNRVSKGVAERFMRDLKSGTMIETRAETGGTIVTICNYEIYQDFSLYRKTVSKTVSKTATGQQRDSNGTATGHKRTPDNTGEHQRTPEKVKETPLESPKKTDLFQNDDLQGLAPITKEKPKTKPKRAIAIPENWTPSDRNIQDAKAKDFTDQEIQNEADQFRDHHLKNGSTYKDWNAAWRYWLGNARRFSANRPMARSAQTGRSGQGSSIASVVAQRRLNGEI